MKVLKYIALLMLIQAPFSPSAIGEETDVPELKYDLKEDGRKWKIGNKLQNDSLIIVQYIPEETTPSPDQFKEVVTVMEIGGVNSNLKEYYNSFVSELVKQASGHNVSHRTIREEGDKNIFGEWWIEEESPQDQHEWFKMFKDGNRLIIIRYTTSDKEIIKNNRAKWERIIGNTKFEDKTVPAEQKN